MFLKRTLGTLAAGSLALTAPSAAQADLARDLAVGVIMGIISGAAQSQNRPAPRTGSRPSAAASQRATAQRSANREVQASLNYFDYPVGAEDGVIGRNTRDGIRRFQTAMGFPPTGELTQLERDFLVRSVARSREDAWRPPYDEIMRRQGAKALLRTYRNEQFGIAPPRPGVQPESTPFAAVPPVAPPQPPPEPERVAAGPEAGPAAQPSIPVFPGEPVRARGVAQHCSTVEAIIAGAGRQSPAGISDATLALNQEFCSLRTYVAADATRHMQEIGMQADAAQVACAQISAVLSPALADLPLLEPEEYGDLVMDHLVDAFGEEILQESAGLHDIGKGCLGIGYLADDARGALAAASVMVALGDAAFGEVLGHHMIGGFGVTAEEERGRLWLQETVAELRGGASPAFFPGTSAMRMDLISAALAASEDQL